MPWKRGHRLHLVAPEDAGAEVAEVYAEMEGALGVPVVDKLHQAYAVFPDFLKAHWEQARKVVVSKQFFSCADRLGADAYTRAHSYMMVPNIRAELAAAKVSDAACEEIRQSVNLFHRRSTYSLLLCSWQRRAFEGPVGSRAAIEVPTPAKDRQVPMMMRDDSMPVSTKKLLEEIRRKCEEPSLDAFYFAMARWPDLLRNFWNGVHGEMASPMYDHSKQAIREYSEQLCDELPGPLELTTVQLLETMEEAEIGSMVRITEAFERSFSALVLNAAWTRIGLEGGNTGYRTKKSPLQDVTARRAS
jgi:hypothetical protein